MYVACGGGGGQTRNLRIDSTNNIVASNHQAGYQHPWYQVPGTPEIYSTPGTMYLVLCILSSNRNLSVRGYQVPGTRYQGPGTRFLRTPSLLMSSGFHLDSRFLAVIDHSVVRKGTGIPNKAGIPCHGDMPMKIQ